MKVIVFIMVILIGHGCAAKKLAVENADTLITHQMTKRLPLYSAQKTQLAKDVDQFLIDTKPMSQEIIPVVDQIDLKSMASVEAQYIKLEKYYKDISKNFSKLMSKYMAKLDHKQQKDFFKTLDDENRDILKREKIDQLDQVEEKFEMFLGSINTKQKQLIREYAEYFHHREKRRLDNRISLHQHFKNIYTHDTSELSKIDLFQEQFIKYQEEMLEGNKNAEILKKVVPTLTDGQREYFREQAQEVKSLLKYFNSIDY
jgi:hypothetical protein